MERLSYSGLGLFIPICVGVFGGRDVFLCGCHFSSACGFRGREDMVTPI
jgi:hypothetical protein